MDEQCVCVADRERRLLDERRRIDTGPPPSSRFKTMTFREVQALDHRAPRCNVHETWRGENYYCAEPVAFRHNINAWSYILRCAKHRHPSAQPLKP